MQSHKKTKKRQSIQNTSSSPMPQFVPTNIQASTKKKNKKRKNKQSLNIPSHSNYDEPQLELEHPTKKKKTILAHLQSEHLKPINKLVLFVDFVFHNLETYSQRKLVVSIAEDQNNTKQQSLEDLKKLVDEGYFRLYKTRIQTTQITYNDYSISDMSTLGDILENKSQIKAIIDPINPIPAPNKIFDMLYLLLQQNRGQGIESLPALPYEISPAHVSEISSAHKIQDFNTKKKMHQNKIKRNIEYDEEMEEKDSSESQSEIDQSEIISQHEESESSTEHQEEIVPVVKTKVATKSPKLEVACKKAVINQASEQKSKTKKSQVQASEEIQQTEERTSAKKRKKSEKGKTSKKESKDRKITIFIEKNSTAGADGKKSDENSNSKLPSTEIEATQIIMSQETSKENEKQTENEKNDKDVIEIETSDLIQNQKEKDIKKLKEDNSILEKIGQIVNKRGNGQAKDSQKKNNKKSQKGKSPLLSSRKNTSQIEENITNKKKEKPDSKKVAPENARKNSKIIQAETKSKTVQNDEETKENQKSEEDSESESDSLPSDEDSDMFEQLNQYKKSKESAKKEKNTIITNTKQFTNLFQNMAKK